MNSTFLSRCFQYFQQGYALLSLPIGLISTSTVIYYLLVDHFILLKVVFPSFIYFIAIGALLFLPGATYFGWVYMKRSKVYGHQQAVTMETNPVAVHNNRVDMELFMRVAERVGYEPNKEFVDMYAFWRDLDERKQKWRP